MRAVVDIDDFKRLKLLVAEETYLRQGQKIMMLSEWG
jgi:hypothetical protein